ncbi:hypothetical protein L3Q82_023776, partial [Scortum barcoo]
AYPHGRRLIREAYEERFSPMEAREVTVHRVVNIVERRSPGPRQVVDYDRGHHDDQWYGGRRNYHDAREYHGESSYPPSDRYFDENLNYGSFRRNSPPPRNEDLYPKQCYSRDDLRHQLGSRLSFASMNSLCNASNRPLGGGRVQSFERNSGRTGQYFRNRGRGSGPPRREDHYRSSPPMVSKRDRSPARRDAQPPVRSGSNTSNRSFSPDTDKGYAHQQAQRKYKPGVLMSHTPSSSVEGSPHSSSSSKEKTSASVAETEEVVAASMEPKLTPEDFKAYRLEAIKAKALEIEEHYRQDCETFRTVVKMLVAKEPSLDKLLQAPLDENLLETKQRCLDTLRQFVKELDEVLEQPETSAELRTKN